MKKYLKLIVCTTLVSGILVGCTSTPVAPDGKVNPDIEASLHVGVMSTVDAAPVYLAKENDYFKSRGLDVQIETFDYTETKEEVAKRAEFDIEVISYIDLLKEQDDTKEILMLTDDVFPIITRQGVPAQGEVKIGVVKDGISEYLADRYLGEYELDKVYISNDVVSINMMKNNEIDMAILPEPIASLAQAEGLEKRMYGSGEDDTPYVMVTSKETMKEKGKAIKAFKKACDEAADVINKDVAIGRAILANTLNIEPEIMEQVIMPKYEIGRKPTDIFEKEITQWLEAKAD